MHANIFRSVIVIILFYTALFAQSLSKKTIITDIKKLRDAINTSSPGDTVEVANGKYDAGTSITVTNSGVQGNPIVVKAQTKGGVELTGGTYFDFRQCANIVLVGADEYSEESVLRKPLTANDVGPLANYISTGVSAEMKVIPNGFYLSQNYPNPFNPSTVIKFRIPNSKFVKLEAHDLLGREIQTLVCSELNSGEYSIVFNGGNLSSGIYFCTLSSNGYSLSRKMILIR
ncbi:MAG: T9SS type A sorting domain-containing protein [Bacteroidetes bacterium]|nr:T9SS type A sorting domain-containing protein [Bacteroidota bacterium]